MPSNSGLLLRHSETGMLQTQQEPLEMRSTLLVAGLVGRWPAANFLCLPPAPPGVPSSFAHWVACGLRSVGSGRHPALDETGLGLNEGRLWRTAD